MAGCGMAENIAVELIHPSRSGQRQPLRLAWRQIDTDIKVVDGKIMERGASVSKHEIHICVRRDRDGCRLKVNVAELDYHICLPNSRYRRRCGVACPGLELARTGARLPQHGMGSGFKILIGRCISDDSTWRH